MFSNDPSASACICSVPPVNVASLAIGVVTSTPVLVEFHLLATTVPPVVITDPTVKAPGLVASIVIERFAESVLVFPAASFWIASIAYVPPTCVDKVMVTVPPAHSPVLSANLKMHRIV